MPQRPSTFIPAPRPRPRVRHTAPWRIVIEEWGNKSLRVCVSARTYALALRTAVEAFHRVAPAVRAGLPRRVVALTVTAPSGRKREVVNQEHQVLGPRP